MVRPRRLPRPFVVLVVALVVSGCARAPETQADERGGSGSGASVSSSTSAPRAEDEESTSTTAPTTTTTAPPTTTTAPPPPPLPTEVGPLQSGVEGVRTKALQEALRAQAFDPGEPDGAFGAKTTMAVWAYQALHGWAADGVVGPELEAQILSAPALPMLRPDLGPTHSEVDLDRQVLLVWGDGRLELVTHVSTGSGIPYCEDGHCGSAVTPTGDYHYQRRIQGARHAPLGVLYDPVYFNGGIAVHGAPSVPNHPASHGCVRIPMHISTYFQSLVADGEPIAVFRGGSGPAAPLGSGAQPAQPPPAGAENGG